ncbi:MAG: SpoIIE family protein phosphatase [Rhodospirillales bacterium]|nr:SpoIIE family protein phosphatase [Rhodospirillales bacterium]MBO6785532.1 SpoIIE family protein phosphatase [Rhodospirillales bacterium]
MTFFHRYNKIMRLTFLVVLVVSGAMFYLQVVQRLDAEKSLISQRLEERASSLNFLLEASAGIVDGMQIQAHTFYNDNPEPPDMSRLMQALKDSVKDGYYTLDDIPAPFLKKGIGNLTGVDLGFTPKRIHELEMALDLNKLFEIAQANIPNAAWVYYTSREKFINIAPWVPSDAFKFTEELYTHSFYYEGLPEANPWRDRFWTEAYIDEAGKGLMVTCAAPVYQGDEFRGTVAIDLTLDVLNRVIADFEGAHGTLFVVNNRNQVLAHPTKVNSSDKKIVDIASVFPASMRGDYEKILHETRPQLTEIGDHFVAVARVSEAPWQVVYIGSRWQMMKDLLRDTTISLSAFLIGLTVMLIIATRSTRREFIKPAQQLVDYIELESERSGHRVPVDIPDTWRPWFEKVSESFSSHDQLVSIRQELDVATRMQQSILPTVFPSEDDHEIAACMIPAKEVGGDFYDFFALDENRIGIVIADVSGKGVPAALFMAVSRTLLRGIATSEPGPGSCLRVTNDLLSAENDQGMFVTTFYGVLDLQSGVFRYANGGHNPPYLIDDEGNVTALATTDGVALGVMEGLDYDENEIVLKPGATVFMFTDGITEAFNENEEEFQERRLQEALAGAEAKPTPQVIDDVVAVVKKFAGNAPQADDITSIVLRYKG